MLVKVVFSGSVQGVGFRYRTEDFARELSIKGTVRNVPDGTVELYAQGSKEMIDALIDKLRGCFANAITHVDRQVVASSTTFSDFRITA